MDDLLLMRISDDVEMCASQFHLNMESMNWILNVANKVALMPLQWMIVRYY